MEVRGLLADILNVDAFITKRTATYIGKIIRADQESLPKKFLTAWINGSQKNGAPQLSCNNNFADAVYRILPTDTLSNKYAPLKEWLPLAKEEGCWLKYIDNYFESCREPDPHEDSDPDRASASADEDDVCTQAP